MLSWESIYVIVRCYVEVYRPLDFEVPIYQDPQPEPERKYDLTELEVRPKCLKELYKASVEQERGEKKELPTLLSPIPAVHEQPGYTAIRTITYKEQKLAIPHSIRYRKDSYGGLLTFYKFLLSQTTLIRSTSLTPKRNR